MLLFEILPDTVKQVASAPCPCATMHISALAYAVCGFVGLIGAVIHFVQTMNESRTLAQKGNYQWTEKTYFSDQKWAIILSLLWVIGWMLVLSEAVAKYESIFEWKKLIFLVIGYGGDSLSAKLAGFATNRALAVIDDKTTQLDVSKGMQNTPTPATMPTDKPK